MRERTVRVVAGILAGAVAAAFGAGGHAQSGAAAESCGFQGVADLRSRSWRHALFAADAADSCERRSAAGGLGVSHEAGSALHRRTCRRTGRRRRQRSRGGHASARRPGPRARPWRFRLRVERSHAARHQRNDVSRDAVLPRRRDRRRPRARKRGRSSFPPGIRRHAASSTGRGTRRRLRKSSSARATPSCTRSTRRPGSRTRPSATRVSVDLNTPEILQGLPGRDGLTSPPIVYKNLVITGGTTQENPPRGPAGDVRAWDMHTGKLVWTFRSVPRAGDKHDDTWAGDSWKNRSGVNVWGFLTVDASAASSTCPSARPRSTSTAATGRATTCSATASSRPTRTRASISGISRSCITTSGTRIWRDRAGPHRCQAGWQDDPGGRRHRQGRPAVPAGSRHRQADLRRGRAPGSRERSAAGTRVEDATVPDQAGAALPHDDRRD